MIIKMAKEISTRKIDNEIFIFNRKMSTIHTLNKIGSFIWDLLEQNIPADDIPAHIAGRFEVEKETAQSDLIEFLDELKENHLIIIE